MALSHLVMLMLTDGGMDINKTTQGLGSSGCGCVKGRTLGSCWCHAVKASRDVGVYRSWVARGRRIVVGVIVFSDSDRSLTGGV